MLRTAFGALKRLSKPLGALTVLACATIFPLQTVSVSAAPPASCTDGTTGVPTGSVVLRGDYLCIGLSDKGTMGVGGSTNPGIRHSPTGNVTTDGNYDYLTPGSPYDGFAIQADNINGGTLLSNTNGGAAAFTGTLTDTSTGSVNSATWTSTNHAAYDVTNVYSFSDDQQTLKVSVTITAKTDIVNLRYLRSMDPDANAGAGDTSSTNNALGYGSLPASDFVYTETLGTKVVLSMYSNSAIPHEAKLFSSCCGIVSPDTASIGNGVGDWGIGMAFYIGDLANGASVVLDYEYRFAGSLADAAGGTPGLPNIDTTRPGGYTIGDVNAGLVNPVFDGGTLTMGSSGIIIAPFAVNATNGAVDTAGNAVVFGGAFSGAGAVTKTGKGTMTLAANNTNAGGFAVTGGTLNLASGGTITGGVNVASGTRFIGNGTVNGTTTVTGSGSMLSGSGTFGDVIINSGATHQPGNSPGTVNVAGNYTINPGGRLEVEVAADGSSDRIIVAGNTALAGDLAIIGYGTGFVAPTYTYNVISTATLSGDFNRLLSDSAFYAVNYALTANTLDVTLTRNGETFKTIARTPNQIEVGRVMDAMPSATYASLMGLLNPAEVRTLLDSLSGEVYASSRTIMGESFARSLTGNATGAATPFTDGCGFGPSSDEGTADQAGCIMANSVRVIASGEYRNYAAGNANATNATSGGIEGQVLLPFEIDNGNSHAWLGVTFAHERGGVRTPDLNSSATTATTGAALLAGWSQGGLDITGTLGFNLGTVEANRIAAGTAARGSFDVNSWGGSLGVSYAIEATDNLTIRPFGALTHAMTSNSAFSETTAGAFGYSGAATTTSQTLATLGLGLSTEFVLDDTIVRPRAEIAVTQRIAGTPGSMTGSFAGSGPFTTQGAGDGDTALKLGIGATVLSAPGFLIDADYGLEASGGSLAHSAKVSMKVSF